MLAPDWMRWILTATPSAGETMGGFDLAIYDTGITALCSTRCRPTFPCDEERRHVLPAGQVAHDREPGRVAAATTVADR